MGRSLAGVGGGVAELVGHLVLLHVALQAQSFVRRLQIGHEGDKLMVTIR